MKTLLSAGGSRRRIATVLLYGQSALFALVGLSCLVHAYTVQASASRAVLGAQLQALLATPMAGPASPGALPNAVRALFGADAPLRLRGLRSLDLRDRDGLLVARHGRFAHWQLRGAVGEGLETLLYRLTGSSGRLPLRSATGRSVGSAEFSFAPFAVDAAQASAVRWLRRVGVLLLVFALAGVPLSWWLLRRSAHRPQHWLRRADPHAPADPTAAMMDAAKATVQFRERAGGILDAIGYGMATTDREGHIRFLNQAAEQLTGWSNASADGRMVYSVFHLSDAQGATLPNPVEATLQSGQDAAPVTGWLRARDGERRPVELLCCLVRNKEQIVDGVVVIVRDVGAQLAELDAQKRNARLSQAVVDHLEEGVLMTDPAGVVRFANARAEAMFGYQRDELAGFTVSKLMPVPFLNTPGIRLGDYMASGPGAVIGRSAPLPKIVGWRKDATTFPVEIWVQPLQLDESSGLVVIVRDISERLRGDKFASRLGRLLDAAVEEVYIFDAQSLMLLEVNRGARRNLGYRSEALQRMTPLDISKELDPQTFRQYLLQLRGGDQDHVVYRCRHQRADGSSYPVEVRLNFSRDEEPPVFMAIAVDISEQLATETRLQQLAHHDALTGLPNRLMLQDRLQQAWLSAQRGSRMLGVFFLDLDRFKQINDQYGHELGDQVLRAVANRLRATLRPSDTVARLAGDEFVILAPGLRGPDDAEQLAQKILDRFAEPLDIPEHRLISQPSIGITLYPLDDSEPDVLMRHADAAMYEAKKAGRSCFRLFMTEIDADRRRRLDLEREIHLAIALNQLHLRMAPVMDLTRGTVLAVLASLYWQHPRLGRIEHQELMRTAVRANLAANLELLQISRVCEHHLGSGRQGIARLPFIIEVSGWQLRSTDFFTQLGELFEHYKVPGDRLILAVDGGQLPEPAHISPRLEALLAQGVRLALRDFSLPLPPLDHPPIALLIADADADEAYIADARAAAIERLLPLVAVHVDHVLQKNRWSAAGCHWLGGAAVQPAMDVQQAISWFEGRKLDEL